LIDIYATAAGFSEAIRWYRNQGFGFFDQGIGVSARFSGDTEVLVRDLDQDSDVDFVCTGGWTPGASDLGTVYCTSNPNSTGVQGTIQITGTRKLSCNAVTLKAAALHLPSFGFFITSTQAGNVSNPAGSEGVLCLGGTIGRYQTPDQVQFSFATGTFQLTIDLQNLPTSLGLVAGSVGETWRFQAWYRDQVSGVPTSNFTNAASMVLE